MRKILNGGNNFSQLGLRCFGVSYLFVNIYMPKEKCPNWATSELAVTKTENGTLSSVYRSFCRIEVQGDEHSKLTSMAVI